MQNSSATAFLSPNLQIIVHKGEKTQAQSTQMKEVTSSRIHVVNVQKAPCFTACMLLAQVFTTHAKKVLNVPADKALTQ